MLYLCAMYSQPNLKRLPFWNVSTNLMLSLLLLWHFGWGRQALELLLLSLPFFTLGPCWSLLSALPSAPWNRNQAEHKPVCSHSLSMFFLCKLRKTIFTLQSPIRSSLLVSSALIQQAVQWMNCLIECCSVPWSVFRAPSPLWACLWGRGGGQGHRSGRELSLCRPAWPRSAYDTQRYQTWLSCYRRGPAPAAGPKPPTEQAQARDQQVRISHTWSGTRSSGHSWKLYLGLGEMYIHCQWTGARAHFQVHKGLHSLNARNQYSASPQVTHKSAIQKQQAAPSEVWLHSGTSGMVCGPAMTAIACPHRSSWRSGGNIAVCRWWYIL